MKKRWIAGLCVLMLSVAGCGQSQSLGKTEENISTEQETADVSTLEVLESVWGKFAEDEKFAINGGDTSQIVSDAPGAFDVTNTEELDASLGFPAAQADSIDEAASMIHMMNANTFTCGAYHLKDASKLNTVADALKENIMNRQWMCGFPDTLVIMVVEDATVVSFFGSAENIENFKAKVMETYENSSVICEENLNF